MVLVQKELQNAYIGEYVQPRTPGADTIAYWTFDGDVLDHSGNNRNLTVLGSGLSEGSPVFDTLGSGKKVANFIKGASQYESNWIAYATDTTGIPSSGNMTISFWMNWSGFGNDTNWQEIVSWRTTLGGFKWMTMLHENTGVLMFHGSAQENTTFTPTTGTWYNIIYTVDNGTCYIYKDATQIYTDSYSYGTQNPTKISIGCQYRDQNSLNHREEVYNGKLGDVIIENVAWDGTTITNYYNLTKGDYGIS